MKDLIRSSEERIKGTEICSMRSKVRVKVKSHKMMLHRYRDKTSRMHFRGLSQSMSRRNSSLKSSILISPLMMS